MSGPPPIATELRTSLVVRFVPEAVGRKATIQLKLAQHFCGDAEGNLRANHFRARGPM